jgi:putative aldouronate transport system permease protein
MSSQKKTLGEKLFHYFIYILMAVFGFIMLLPLLTVASVSLSSPLAADTGKVFILPVDFTFASWGYIFSLSRLWKSLLLTTSTTLSGTVLSLLLNALMAYPLSKKEFTPGRFILMGIAITMIFKAPIIPYFLTLKSIGLFDNFLVLIAPHLFVSYFLIIMVTFLRQVPKELEESAMIEGCGYLQTLFKIILPSSKAMLATVGLFYAVMIWNQFMHPLLFIQNQNLYPLQLVIRSFIAGDEMIRDYFSIDKKAMFNDTTVKAAVVMFSALPVIMVYPYLQKYFVKGAMVGSIKG